MSGVADPIALVAWLIHALQARRVLEIGAGSARRSVQIAASLPPEGQLITMEQDQALAAAVREACPPGSLTSKVSVIVGDPTRYLHKIAGPFDLIVQDACLALGGRRRDRLWQLLRPAGTLFTTGLQRREDYNEQLATDVRFHTIVLAISDGVAVSVKRLDV